MVLNLNFNESLQGHVMKSTSAEATAGPGVSLSPLTYLLGDVSSVSNISVSHHITFKKAPVTVPISQSRRED